METWVQVITSVGFPIFACLCLGYYVFTQINQYRADIKDIQKEHKEELSKMTDALNNNTLMIQKLCDKLDKEDNNG